MNKGLFYHLIFAFIYVLLVMYVVQDAKLEIGSRVLVVVIGLIFQLIPTAINTEFDNYNKKL